MDIVVAVLSERGGQTAEDGGRRGAMRVVARDEELEGPYGHEMVRVNINCVFLLLLFSMETLFPFFSFLFPLSKIVPSPRRRFSEIEMDKSAMELGRTH